jgi:hypothetical protein
MTGSPSSTPTRAHAEARRVRVRVRARVCRSSEKPSSQTFSTTPNGPQVDTRKVPHVDWFPIVAFLVLGVGVVIDAHRSGVRLGRTGAWGWGLVVAVVPIALIVYVIERRRVTRDREARVAIRAAIERNS